MFVPVITKDMQLFPAANRQPLPPRIKNVRSRAQSLEEFAKQGVNRSGVSASTASVAIARQRATPNVPHRQHSSKSVGSLPMGLANGRSPPNRKNSIRRPLYAIAEGVEIPSTKKKGNSETEVSNGETRSPSQKSTPDLQDLKIRPTSSLSTSSSPGLDKTWSSPSSSHPPPPSNGEKEKKGLMKWLKHTLNGKSNNKENNGDNRADDDDGKEDPEMEDEKARRKKS